MTTKTLKTRIQLRNDTEANWTSNNPTLAKGEIAVSTDKNDFKIGDGTSAWSALSYYGASISIDSLDASKLTGTASVNTTGSAATLTTSHNFSITDGATASAVAFNGSNDVALSVTSLDAQKLSQATTDWLILDGGTASDFAG